MSIRLVTVNLYNGRADAAHLGRILEVFHPHVVAAQEVGLDAARRLADRFPYGLAEGGTDHRGRALVSTLPMEVEELDLPYRPGLGGRIEVDGELWEVSSVHLANPVGIPPRLRERRDQIDALVPHIAAPGRRVLVGDLNSTPIWPAYRSLSRLLDDGIAECARRNGRRPPRTWGYRPWMPSMLRIDHVLVAGLTVEAFEVVRVRGTDHRLVVADVSVEAAAGPGA